MHQKNVQVEREVFGAATNLVEIVNGPPDVMKDPPQLHLRPRQHLTGTRTRTQVQTVTGTETRAQTQVGSRADT